MAFVQMLEAFLFQVSSGLYAPVICAVSLLSLYVMWIVGASCAEAWQRSRHGSADVQRFQRSLTSERAKGTENLEARLFKLLRQHELGVASRLDRVRFVIKVGPALGLMGTLIPMGVSLASLAEGNIPKMAGSMVTAFTATVAGLACGVIAYLVALVREKWARADILEMEFSAETLDVSPLSMILESDDVLAISQATQGA